MAASSKDDPYKRPNRALDGVIPKILQPEPKPWWELDEFKKWTPGTYPALPGPPIGPKPWWLDPSTPQTLPDPPPGSYPYWVNPPTPPALPPPPHDVAPPKHTNSLVTENLSGRAEGAPTNWLLSSYDQNGDDRHRPINSVPGIGPATGAAPAESAGGLLGMLYDKMGQSKPDLDGGFDPNPQVVSQQGLPERRLGRRTYRP